jgi:hypothetical protein
VLPTLYFSCILLETLVWKELNTSGQKLPPRAGHSTVSFGKNLFVFGGFTDAQNLYDDLHMLNVGMYHAIVDKVLVMLKKCTSLSL